MSRTLLIFLSLWFSLAAEGTASSDCNGLLWGNAAMGRLGAQLDVGAQELRLGIFSRRATRIQVEVFDRPFNGKRIAALVLEPSGSGVWSGRVSLKGLSLKNRQEIYYGFRAWGPNWPYHPQWEPGSTLGFLGDVIDGDRFNPNKLLSDPYGLALSHNPLNSKFSDGSAFSGGPAHRHVDTSGFAPKSVAFDVRDIHPTPAFRRPRRALRDDIVYEAHVRGLTMLDPKIPPEYRGTFRGAGLKAKELKALGITAIEFLPVFEFQNQANDVDGKLANYWGYMSESFFALSRRYSSAKSSAGVIREFQAMVRAFHAEGIKVYLDVVYNHTAEGNTDPTGEAVRLSSWMGLDSQTYYQVAEDSRYFVDTNGVGANLNTANPVVQRHVIDSLRYAHEILGVDGFRFDLASVLNNRNERGRFDYDPNGLLRRIAAELPVRARDGGPGVDLIGEPWGYGTYNLGQLPPKWTEWNDLYRDTIRRFQNRLGVAPENTPGRLASVISGSDGLFNGGERGPESTLNYIVSHDGFTLRDLYSHNGKVNQQPYPYGPSDGGPDANFEWDQGGNPALQRQAARTGLALLLLSTGVPMITSGDEILRTQRGNNNPWNLDTHGMWTDWATRSQPEISAFETFTRRLFKFRSDHPALRPAAHFRGQPVGGTALKDITWYQANGAEADPAYMASSEPFLAWRINGAVREGTSAESILVAYNADHQGREFHLPPNREGRRWHLVADTSEQRASHGNFFDEDRLLDASAYSMDQRSVSLFVER